MTECQSDRGSWGEPCPECGQVLPVAKDWSEGRPCSRTSLDRGRGWDGRPLPEHPPGVVARWATTGRALRQRPIRSMPAWIRRAVDAVMAEGGDRARAADRLKVSREELSSTLSVARKRHDLTADEREALVLLRHRRGPASEQAAS